MERYSSQTNADRNMNLGLWSEVQRQIISLLQRGKVMSLGREEDGLTLGGVLSDSGSVGEKTLKSTQKRAVRDW